MNVHEVFTKVLEAPPDASIIVEFEDAKRLESFRVQMYREMNLYKRSGGKGAIRIERNKKNLSLELSIVPEPIKVYLKQDDQVTQLSSDINAREMIARMLADGLSPSEVVALFPDIEGSETQKILDEIAAMRPLEEEMSDGEDN